MCTVLQPPCVNPTAVNKYIDINKTDCASFNPVTKHIISVLVNLKDGIFLTICIYNLHNTYYLKLLHLNAS